MASAVSCSSHRTSAVHFSGLLLIITDKWLTPDDITDGGSLVSVWVSNVAYAFAESSAEIFAAAAGDLNGEGGGTFCYGYPIN